MLHDFLDTHRAELAMRCKARVATRASTAPTGEEVEFGVPVLIDQMIDVLRAELRAKAGAALAVLPLGIARSATKHGGELLRRGFSVDQVVYDYGDLCQALTELAAEKSEPITVDEFHTFNRCLDSAIADAVREFGRQQARVITEQGEQTLNERLGFLAHEMRNLLNTAMLAFAAVKDGSVTPGGATGAVLERSHDGLRDLIDRALADVRLTNGLGARRERTPLDVILEEVRVSAQLDANARGLVFNVEIEDALAVEVDREMMSSALANLLQNAFKFTNPGGRIALSARLVGERILIEVADQCGGLPPGRAEELFLPFNQRGTDRSGLGLGLSISRRAVEANGGTLHVRNVPSRGCVFTIDLPSVSPLVS